MRPPFLLRLYGGLANIAAPLLFRRIAARLVGHGIDPKRTRELRGHATKARPDGPLVWFHAASVGESLSVMPLVTWLNRHDPTVTVLITSGTASSAKILAQRLPEGAIHQFAPLDSRRILKRFMAHWQPDSVVLVESEIWPQMIQRVTGDGLPLVLLNTRLSDRSLRRWQNLGAAAQFLMQRFTLIITQTAQTEQAMIALGVDPDRIHTGSNLKAAAPPPPDDPAQRAIITAQIGDRPLWLAVSTHVGEEEIILDTHRILRDTYPDLCLILAPRHIERASRIMDMANSRGFTIAQRSKGDPATADVYLADTVGELGIWMRMAPVTLMGGALTPNGGHNPWEGAAIGTALLSGPHVTNCVQDYDALKAANAVVMTDQTTLARDVDALLADKGLVTAIANNAKALAAAQTDDADNLAQTLYQMINAVPRKGPSR